MLAIRAIAAFLALPAMVAGVVPAILLHDSTPSRDPPWVAAGACLTGAGLILLLWCVRDFYVSGRGTLAPWDPPRKLVVVGLYRLVRNPMYLAVLATVAGWATLYRSAVLAVYVTLLAAAFHIRVVIGEERWLRRQFKGEWETYCRTTPRWIPSIAAAIKHRGTHLKPRAEDNLDSTP